MPTQQKSARKTDITEEVLLKEFNLDPTSIERWIMLGIIRSGRFYREVRPRVCPRQKDGRLRHDFLAPRYNQLYAAADRFWRLMDKSVLEPDIEIPRRLLETLLVADVKIGRVTEEEHAVILEEIANFFYSYAVLPPALMKSLHRPLETWLSMRNATFAINTIHREAGIRLISMADVREVVDAFSKDSNAGKNRIVKGTDLARRQIVQHARITTGITDLDRAIGGGIGRGEVMLAAGANGAGKTVLACQMALHFAVCGLNVLYCSTEEGPEKLIQRKLCNYTNVRYEHFVNRAELAGNHTEAKTVDVIPGFILTDPNSSELAQMFFNNVLPHIDYLDWAQGEGLVVKDQLESDLNKYRENHGRWPDVLIFDWIGGAIDQGEKPEHLRHRYYEAVNCIVDLTKAHPSMASIVLAQVDKAKAARQTEIKMIHLAECKAMSDNVTIFVGISSLSRNEKADDFPNENLSDIQFLNVDKARFGPKGKVKVLRHFQFQRFANYAKVQIGE